MNQKNHMWNLAGLGINVFLTNWSLLGIDIGLLFSFFQTSMHYRYGKGWCPLDINLGMCIDKIGHKLIGHQHKTYFFKWACIIDMESWVMPTKHKPNPSRCKLTKLVIMGNVFKQKNQVDWSRDHKCDCETITNNWNRTFSNVILLLTSKDYSPTFQNFELWIPQELLKS